MRKPNVCAVYRSIANALDDSQQVGVLRVKHNAAQRILQFQARQLRHPPSKSSGTAPSCSSISPLRLTIIESILTDTAAAATTATAQLRFHSTR